MKPTATGDESPIPVPETPSAVRECVGTHR